jgi:alpha-tubulin suppressor-like RCC1 family protein
VGSSLHLSVLVCCACVVCCGCGTDSSAQTDDDEPDPDAEPEVCPSRPAGRRAVDIAVGDEQGFALLSDGTLWCWGSRPTFICPGGLPKKLDLPCIKVMDAQTDYAGVVTMSGRLLIWGEASEGAFIEVEGQPAWIEAGPSVLAWGDGTSAWWWGEPSWLGVPVAAPALVTDAVVSRVFLGSGHACFSVGGQLYCLGRNQAGQLGNGATAPDVDTAVLDPVQAAVPALVIAAEAAIPSRTYALDDSGNLWAWGRSEPFSEEPSGPWPQVWSSVPAFCGFDRGADSGCGWTCAGEVYCWGYSPYGLFILDPLAGWHPPTRIRDLEPAAEVRVTTSSPLCVRKTDGTVWCRGGYGTGADIRYDDARAVQLKFED